ncbi:hypothetical protein A1O3_01469 [Capronia epimyces CBS 606.96]|uniref:EthD domain-containing protein n=1 Tax=Capronia epimyces CBS 606.96 TaxID=1182542 RepID=W9YK53_9EURO|nr:uncharacterized protein A1O3_01469 [Capronia epimyces CBS 606.96]EXJ92913.1 hypothetical protein A1O3_01469 [Capronia epimyces CBS 606.96]
MATKQRLVRLSFYVQRKKNLSEEEYERHLSSHHAELCAEHLAKHGILRYTQFHTPASFQAVGESGFPGLKKMKRLPFDSSGDFLMADFASFVKFQEDPYYLSHVFPDEAGLFEWDTACYAVGWEEVYIQDGKVVNLPYQDPTYQGPTQATGTSSTPSN